MRLGLVLLFVSVSFDRSAQGFSLCRGRSKLQQQQTRAITSANKGHRLFALSAAPANRIEFMSLTPLNKLLFFPRVILKLVALLLALPMKLFNMLGFGGKAVDAGRWPPTVTVPPQPRLKVSLNKEGVITDDTRIRCSIPTI